MTSSPGPTPIASNARCNASSPLPKPTQYPASQYAAYWVSNASTSGPRMYQPDSTTLAMAASISSRNSTCGAFRSRKGITAASPQG